MFEEDSIITLIIKEKKLKFAEIKTFVRIRKVAFQNELS